MSTPRFPTMGQLHVLTCPSFTEPGTYSHRPAPPGTVLCGLYFQPLARTTEATTGGEDSRWAGKLMDLSGQGDNTPEHGQLIAT